MKKLVVLALALLVSIPALAEPTITILKVKPFVPASSTGTIERAIPGAHLNSPPRAWVPPATPFTLGPKVEHPYWLPQPRTPAPSPQQWSR
jgi:hypothetical protein